MNNREHGIVCRGTVGHEDGRGDDDRVDGDKRTML